MKVKKNVISQLLVLLAATILPAISIAQITLERQVIGSAGNFSEVASDINVSSTIGEAVTASFLTTEFEFTQGFQQPDVMLLDEVSFQDEPQKSICPDIQDGKIIVNSLNGCLAPYVVRLRKYEIDRFVTVDSIPNQNLGAQVVFENLGIDTFLVEVIGASYCVKSDTFFLDAKYPTSCALKAYSGITPNNDGSNDSWIIDNIELFPDNEVTIFNRWGNLVWEGKNYDNDEKVWLGENRNGNNLPDATYFYVIKTNPKTYSGWVEVTR